MFEKGDKVICIDGKFAGWVPELYQQLPKQGRTYTIRAVRLGRGNPVNETQMPGCGVKPGDQDGEILVLLEEIRNAADPMHLQHGELGFKGERFRKIEQKKESDEYEDTYSGSVSRGHATSGTAGRTDHGG